MRTVGVERGTIYTAVNATAARAAFDDFAEVERPYPAVIRLWDNAWARRSGSRMQD